MFRVTNWTAEEINSGTRREREKKKERKQDLKERKKGKLAECHYRRKHRDVTRVLHDQNRCSESGAGRRETRRKPTGANSKVGQATAESRPPHEHYSVTTSPRAEFRCFSIFFFSPLAEFCFACVFGGELGSGRSCGNLLHPPPPPLSRLFIAASSPPPS